MAIFFHKFVTNQKGNMNREKFMTDAFVSKNLAKAAESVLLLVAFCLLTACQSSDSEQKKPKVSQPLPQLIVQEKEFLSSKKLEEEIPAPKIGRSSDADSMLSLTDQKSIIRFLSELYGLDEYQGFLFNDRDFFMPHCSEALIQKLGLEDEEVRLFDSFSVPADEEESSVNSLISVEYKRGNTFQIRYIDHGHQAVSEIDANIVFGKVWLNDVRLIEWGEEILAGE